ncbi:YlxR family protein [Actinobaculum sp. oral taxon 183]|uniref:YlxR family protein n=1 Tax=Actinobaculum sp. oral taxon 183 TaxID=712888 RepID=UPI0022B53908|nr:YlxR family protein [Actinobaculum sp. oral taxon 183]
MAPLPRTCVGCRAKDDRARLVRVAVDASSAVVDERRVLPGRGAWVHPDPACLARALRTRAFDRALRVRGIDVSSLHAWREAIVGGV